MSFRLESSSFAKVKGSVEDGGPKSRKNLKALIVDDNPVNRKILKMQLFKLGVESQEVENGQEAVDLHHNGAMFDVIFMDKEMPVMDGPQATREFRAMGVHTKIVGVSGHSRTEDVEEFRNAGLDDFYVKPITLSELLSVVQELKD